MDESSAIHEDSDASRECCGHRGPAGREITYGLWLAECQDNASRMIIVFIDERDLQELRFAGPPAKTCSAAGLNESASVSWRD
jgi:hypothetical protein